jgi:hypothetical protein
MEAKQIVGTMKLWTKEEKEFIITFYPTSKSSDIAEALGRTTGSIMSEARVLGLKAERNTRTRKKSTWTAEEERALIFLCDKLAWEEIGELIHKSHGAVIKKAGKLGIRGKGAHPTRPIVNTAFLACREHKWSIKPWAPWEVDAVICGVPLLTRSHQAINEMKFRLVKKGITVAGFTKRTHWTKEEIELCLAKKEVPGRTEEACKSIRYKATRKFLSNMEA